MKRIPVALVVLGAAALPLCAAPVASADGGGRWSATVPFTNVVASSPTTGGGYPVPPGSRVPVAGTCREGPFNANHSESWLAVKPGTEDLVGTSKFFFDKYSTFYMFYLGAYQIVNGTPSGNNQVQGYDCVSTGTQNMPPSWTDSTDPNADFDTKSLFESEYADLHVFLTGAATTRTDLSAGPSGDDADGMDGRGPAQVRAGDPGSAAAGDDRAAGADDRRPRPAAEGRPRAGLVDADHAPGLVAPGPRRLRLAPAAG